MIAFLHKNVHVLFISVNACWCLCRFILESLTHLLPFLCARWFMCLLGRSGAPLALPPRPFLRSDGARLLQFFQFNPRPLWSLAASSVLSFTCCSACCCAFCCAFCCARYCTCCCAFASLEECWLIACTPTLLLVSRPLCTRELPNHDHVHYCFLPVVS